jgi:tyrosine-protein kinase Etk/Wzc
MSDLLDARFDLGSVYGVRGSDEVREELRSRTSVDVRDEGVIVVAVEDRSPERAKAIAEAYIHYIDSLLIEFSVEHAGGRKDFLEREVARREHRIAAADSVLGAFLTEHGIFEIEEQARAAIEVATRLEMRMNAVRLEKELLEMTLLPGSPDLVRAEQMLEKMAEQVVTVREGRGFDLFPSLRDVPDLASEYLRLYGELKIQEFALEYIRLKLEDEAILTNKDVSVIRVIDPPVAPQRRAWPKRKQIVMISTFAAFFWACFGLIVKERWREGFIAFESPPVGPGTASGGGPGTTSECGPGKTSGGGRNGREAETPPPGGSDDRSGRKEQ